MTALKKTLSLLSALERSNTASGLSFADQLSATSAVTGVSDRDALNLLREARIEQCIAEIDALVDEVSRLRSAIEGDSQPAIDETTGPEQTPDLT